MGEGNCRRKEHRRITPGNPFWKSHLCPVPSPTSHVASGSELILITLLLSRGPPISVPSEMGWCYPILKPQPRIFPFEKFLCYFFMNPKIHA